MLKLNPLQEQIDIQLADLNTSYVEVKHLLDLVKR